MTRFTTVVMALAALGCEVRVIDLGSLPAPAAVAPDAAVDCEIDRCNRACPPRYRLIGALNSPEHGTSKLVRIDTTSGFATPIATLPWNLYRLSGMTYVPDRHAVYAIARSVERPRLMRLDLDTYRMSPVGRVTLDNPLAIVDGLAYDQCERRLYAVGGFVVSLSDTVMTVDLDDAQATLVGSVRLAGEYDALAFAGCEAVAVDAISGGRFSFFMRIDGVTDVTEQVRLPGVVIEDLAYDPTNGDLYAAASDRQQLVRIDVGAGTSTIVGATHLAGNGDVITAIAFVPECAPQN